MIVGDRPLVHSRNCARCRARADARPAGRAARRLDRRQEELRKSDREAHRSHAPNLLCRALPSGMGGIFLRRPNRPRSEILNDINGEIVNTFRIARDHPDTLAAEFDLCLASRKIFGRLLATPPESLTDIRRAARWVYLQRLSYAGKPAHLAAPGSLGPSARAPARMVVSRIFRTLVLAACSIRQPCPAA